LDEQLTPSSTFTSPLSSLSWKRRSGPRSWKRFQPRAVTAISPRTSSTGPTPLAKSRSS